MALLVCPILAIPFAGPEPTLAGDAAAKHTVGCTVNPVPCPTKTVTIQPPCASPAPGPGSNSTIACTTANCILLTTVTGTCPPLPSLCFPGQTSTATVYGTCSSCRTGCATTTVTQTPRICPA